ncbi:MAG TPA: DedA family protein [Bacteroidales bacterium]|nr:DedA family protein [Bacteroidales bacterium]HQH19846.1 DedA family protein [Bacteroidales bacterium]
MGITEFLVEYIVAFINSTGYASVFILMILESMIMPIPSEAVMPFAGFLIESGRFTFAGVVFFSTLGSIVGSLISYYMGYYGGRPIVDKYGKYLLLNHHHLELTEKYFTKKGELTIFISRFIPVVRHLISIPAGMGKMNIWKFSIYTIVGAALWNAFLTYVGMLLKDNWNEILKYSSVIDIVIVIALVILIIYTAYKLFKARNKNIS